MSESVALKQQRGATELIESLHKSGVRLFVISPGSRSTPLVSAVSKLSHACTVVHYDERGGAYFAIGYARAAGSPAALISTSGTAVANYFPAVVEAFADNVPVILLTADRPARYRKSGANQTIEQPGIFGRYVCCQLDVDFSDGRTSFSELGARVFDDSTKGRAPVHVNCQFDEPLLAQD